jgi:hypothetical protein
MREREGEEGDREREGKREIEGEREKKTEKTTKETGTKTERTVKDRANGEWEHMGSVRRLCWNPKCVASQSVFLTGKGKETEGQGKG